MSYLGFVRLFSAPFTAFVVSAIIVSAIGYLLFRFGKSQRADAAARYWKLLALLAEICVAVGLIGLATFAGRMKISADHQNLEELVHRSQTTVDDSFRMAILHNCAPDGTRALEPFNPSVAKKDLCAIAREYSGVPAADANWGAAEKSLRAFDANYPGCIPNVFTRHSDCDNTVAEALRIADEIALMELNKRTSRNDEAMAAMLEAPNAWGFMLLAFFVAAIGVAIKCARAAADFFSPESSGHK
jgi:hypothetical protein